MLFSPGVGRTASVVVPKVVKGGQSIYQRVEIYRKLNNFNNLEKQRINHAFSKSLGGKSKFGHMEDTPANRKMLVETWVKGERVEVDRWGKRHL